MTIINFHISIIDSINSPRLKQQSGNMAKEARFIDIIFIKQTQNYKYMFIDSMKGW